MMKPNRGDVVYIVDRNGKKTHNKTHVMRVWENYDDYWHIHDEFAVPMKVRWNGESWIQCIERPSETKTKSDSWIF